MNITNIVLKVVNENLSGVLQTISAFPLSKDNITDHLWGKYCSEDGGLMFLSKIIDGANIAAISTHFFGDNEKRYLDTDYLKKFILYTGLEFISVESAMMGNINDTFLQNIADMIAGISESEEERLAPIVIKHSVRELIPKVYTVSSTYRYLDSLLNIEEDGCYEDMANIEEEYKKIYADTVNEWENESGDTLSSINNGIIDFENNHRYFLLIDNNMYLHNELMNTLRENMILLISEILNTNLKLYDNGYHWGISSERATTIEYSTIIKIRSFILLFFKNLRERTINYK